MTHSTLWSFICILYQSTVGSPMKILLETDYYKQAWRSSDSQCNLLHSRLSVGKSHFLGRIFSAVGVSSVSQGGHACMDPALVRHALFKSTPLSRISWNCSHSHLNSHLWLQLASSWGCGWRVPVISFLGYASRLMCYSSIHSSLNAIQGKFMEGILLCNWMQ